MNLFIYIILYIAHDKEFLQLCRSDKSHEMLNLPSAIIELGTFIVLTVDKCFTNNEFISSMSCCRVIMLLKNADKF